MTADTMTVDACSLSKSYSHSLQKQILRLELQIVYIAIVP